MATKSRPIDELFCELESYYEGQGGFGDVFLNKFVENIARKQCTNTTRTQRSMIKNLHRQFIGGEQGVQK